MASELPPKFAGSGDSVSSAPLCWKQSFPSELLQADVKTLHEQNLEVAAARARVDRASAAYGIAGSALFPDLSLKAGFDRTRIKEDGDAHTNSAINFGAALHWELDIWGRLKAKTQAASLLFEEQKALARKTALDIQTLLVESWVVHHAARKLEQVLMEQRKTNAQFLELTELRLAQGQGNALDVLQQRGRLVAAERALPAITSRKQRAANAYAVLLGRFPDGRGLAKDDWPEVERLNALTTPARLLVDRPDLQAAFLAFKAADQEAAAAIADRLPRLSIGLSYEESGSSLGSIGDNAVLRFASGLLAPIFDAGRLKAKAAKREAEAREALAILEQAVLTAVCQVEDALVQEQALFKTQMLLKEEIAIAEDTVEKAKLRYVNGQESFLSVLVALVNLQNLQQGEILLKQELLLNRIHLLKALGAKWS